MSDVVKARVMRGYEVNVTCPACGADVEPVTEGRVIHNKRGAGTETRAIMRCSECSPTREYVLDVFLSYAGISKGRVGEPAAERVGVLDERRMAHLAVVREMAGA